MVCTSLEELRGLISKTEDELDDLESTKKRLVSDNSIPFNVSNFSVENMVHIGKQFFVGKNNVLIFIFACDLSKDSFV